MGWKLSILVFVATGLSACAGAGPSSCASGPSGSGDPSSHASPDAAAPAGKRVFVTSGAYSPLFGGVAQGDQLCQQVADGANLGGTWKAWLSDETNDAIDRIADVGPWYTLTGALVFENHQSLASTPASPINVDERGNTDPEVEAWTGTDSGGRRTKADCVGWTNTNDPTNGYPVGATYGSGSGQDWTNFDAQACTKTASLFCFEQ